MSIRRRLLYLIVLCAALPLIVTLAVWTYNSVVVAGRLIHDARAALLDQAERQLERATADQAAVLGREVAAAELSVVLQSKAATDAFEILHSPNQPPQQSQSPPRINFDAATPAERGFYFSTDFDNPDLAPPDLTDVLDRRGRPLDNRRYSLTYPAIGLAPGTDINDPLVRADIKALLSLTDAFRQSRVFGQGLAAGHYISTQRGVHMKYPGHGGYPPNFDPRKRPWYQLAIDLNNNDDYPNDRPIWSPPIIDVSSGRSMISVSMPIRDPTGEVIAVTGLDLRFSDLLAQVGLAVAWAGDTNLLIIDVDPPPSPADTYAAPDNNNAQPKDQSLFVYATDFFSANDTESAASSRGTSTTAARPAWDQRVDNPRFSFDEPEFTAALVAAVHARRPSLLQRVHLDKQEVLAASSVITRRDTGGSAVLVVAVPISQIAAQADAAGQRYNDALQRQRAINFICLILVFAGMIWLALRTSASFTRPIEELQHVATDIARGNLDTKARIHRRDEIGKLAKAFNTMVPRLREHVELRESLDLAMEVQQHLLPRGAPNVGWLDIAGGSVYCDQTGGDYFDYFDIADLGEGRVGIAVGDVTGHGIAAALLMTTARALLRVMVVTPGTLAEHATAINRHLSRDVILGRFMTLSYHVFDKQANAVRWISAGHDPAIIYAPKDNSFTELEGGDIPLGIDIDWPYREFERTLPTGPAIIAIGTDGVWEARSPNDELFGKQRLREILRAHANRPAAEIYNEVVSAVTAFREGKPPTDDITLVIVRIHTNQSAG